MTTTVCVWTGCYSDRWPGDLLGESVVHPAKFARGLIRRIYSHCRETGLLVPGDTVLDPFAGVGLGALDALIHGLNWVGVEVEPLFVTMGGGCHCTGIGKEDWVRFFGRWKRAAYNERCWCPRCLAEAGQVIAPKQSMFFAPPPAAAYVRHSGRIPSTGPHLYEGNLQRFARFARNEAQARLIRGDSRQLVEVLAGGNFKALISSPPYVHSVHDGNGIDRRKLPAGTGARSQAIVGGGYGREAGQLGVMPAGSFDAVISSPPYESSLNQHPTANDTSRRLARMRRAGIDVDVRSNPGGTNGVMRRAQVYGQETGQLGIATGDTFWSAARQVIEQCHALLLPGSPAVWVVKDYVRDGQRVEFARQWREMCQAAGFDHLYDIHASFIEERGCQLTLDGEAQVKRIERKSFFRRLVEQAGAPEINEEIVIFTRTQII